MTATLTTQQVRAKIVIGLRQDINGKSVIDVSTPDVVSFNVSRKRGQKSATFSASIKVPYDVFTGAPIKANTINIYAGLKGDMDTNMETKCKIFTGYIYQMVINPIRTDASKIMLNLSGADTFSIMDGQNITRRVSAKQGTGRFGVITGVIAENTPQTRRFPTKVDSGAQLAIPNLISTYAVTTPDAFESSLDRSGNGMIPSGLNAELVTDQTGTGGTT